jgi:hypothetical protein
MVEPLLEMEFARRYAGQTGVGSAAARILFGVENDSQLRMSRNSWAAPGISGRIDAEALASMEDVGQILGIDAEPFRSFFDRQPLANDEADGRPIEGGFRPGVVLALHVRCALHP